MKGWVYIISNRAMPGLVKVGYSSKDPEMRAKELEGTGSPFPYEVDYEILVPDPYLVEQETHKRLSNKREAKEWFKVSLDEAILSIRSVAVGKIQVENFIKADKEKIIVEERIQLERKKKDEDARRKKEAEKIQREKRAEELRLKTEDGRKEKFNDLRPAVRKIIEKCTSEHGLFFKTNKIHPNRATVDDLLKFFWFICEENGVKCVLDIKDFQSKKWWDDEWGRDGWIEEAYKKIAEGKVEDKNIGEFVYLISGHTVGGPDARSIWRLKYSNCKEAIDYLKRKYVSYKNLDYNRPRYTNK